MLRTFVEQPIEVNPGTDHVSLRHQLLGLSFLLSPRGNTTSFMYKSKQSDLKSSPSCSITSLNSTDLTL